MRINLYKFAKKPNSLALPNVQPTSLDCLVKTPSSVINPTVQVSKDVNPVAFNYAYIPEWDRYYFIQDVTYNLGTWLIDLRVDVLASYRENILNSQQYVLRSYSQFNDNILDNLYTTKAKGSNNFFKNEMGQVYALDISPIPDPVTFFDKSYTQGMFIVGIISPNDTGVSYYSLTFDKFSSFLSDLMDFVPNDMSDLASGTAKSLFDPIQYITMCKWYPIGPIPTTPKNKIRLGAYNIDLNDTVASFDNARMTKLYGDIELPKHPQISEHGAYMQLQPYSSYNLYFEPFGDITLNNLLVYGAESLRCEWLLDYCTGKTALSIINNTTGALVGTAMADMGVDIPISQITVDYIGALTSVAGGVTGAIGSWLMGDVGGAINSAISGIGNAAYSEAPKVASIGAQGSFIPYKFGKPYIYLNTLDQVDVDNVRYGRPLCEVKRIGSLSGYCLCSNSSIEIGGTSAEASEIESMLNSGVFIE